MLDVQATFYRRRAIVAKQTAMAAIDPCVRSAFAEIAGHWLALAEHVEWLQSLQRGSLRGDGVVIAMATAESKRLSN